MYKSDTSIAGYRVFIRGIEVTDFITSIKIQYHDGGQSSMATISMTNEFDRFVVTPKDIANLARVDVSNIIDETSLPRSTRDENDFRNARITSSFGPRTHPVTGEKNKMHKGIDYASPIGTPVIAPHDGVVATIGAELTEAEGGEVGKNTGAGHYISVKTDDNHLYRIFHLREPSTLSVGQRVRAGSTVLGFSGNTGGSTGPHIHYEVIELNDEGKPLRHVNPIIYDREDLSNELDTIAESIASQASVQSVDFFDSVFPGEVNRIKREMMRQKYFVGRFVTGDKRIFLQGDRDNLDDTSTARGPFAKLKGWVPQYQIYSGSTVFHTSDPIRIFLQDPYDPYVWYYGFTGYITNDSDVIDVNNNKEVQFTCEDVTRAFKYARIGVNPQLNNPDILTLINDQIIYSGTKEPFNKLSIVENMFFQVFGGEPTGISNADLGISSRPGGSLDGQNTEFFSGVGNFDIENSRVFIFGTPPEKSPERAKDFMKNISAYVKSNDVTLPEYQRFVHHKVEYGDLNLSRINESSEDLTRRSEFASDILLRARDEEAFVTSTIQTSLIWETITFIGENIDLYPMDGRLIMIFPASLSPTSNTDVMTQALGDYSVTNSNFVSRFSIMKQMAERIDFSFYASPRGDLLFEMPFYDFHPDDFNVDTEIPSGANRNIYTEKREIGGNVLLWPKYKELPSYAHAFTIGKNNRIDYSRTFSDASIRTMLVTGYWVAKNNPDIGNVSEIIGDNTVAVSESLFVGFGSRSETINSHAYIASPEAAQLFAEIQLNKINSSANSLSVSVDAKFDLFLNRPIRVIDREILGTLRSYTHDINIGSRTLSTSSISLNNTRVWAGAVSNQDSMDGEKRKIFEPIGTSASKAIDYAALFGFREETKTNSNKPNAKVSGREPKE